MLSFARLPVREDNIEMNVSRLYLAAMKSHQFVTHDSTLENLQYRLLFAFDLDNPRFVRIPAPVLFDTFARDGYSFPEEMLDQYLAALAPRRSHRRSRRIWSGSSWHAPTGAYRHCGSRSQFRPKA